MKETLLIQTTLGDEKRSQIWSDNNPVPIGQPFRWVIERTPEGVRIRDLLRGNLVKVSAEDARRGTRVELRDPQERRTQQAPILYFKATQPIPPAYVTGNQTSEEKEKSSLPMLFAYGGMRRSLVSCTLIHSAYVAYESGEPAFALYHHKEGYRVKTLAAGVRLKLKGQKPIVGEPGTVWELKKEELARVTLFRGWHWWRFASVNAPGPISSLMKMDDENRLFKKLGMMIGGAILLVSAIALWFGPKASDDADLDNTPIVKLDSHKSKVFLKKAANASNSAQLASGDPWKAPSVAPAPAPIPVKAPPVQSASAPSHNKVSARDRETKKALQEAKSLKDALGGLKSMGLNGVTSPQGKLTSGGKHTGVFDGPQGASGSAVALNTDVKPLLSGSQVEVHGIGGSGVGGHGSATQGVGYAQSGVHGPVSGQGGSFVSLGDGGYKADEGLTKEEVGAVIHGHMGEVRYCHEAAMLQNPKTEGRLVLQFKIDPRGRVEMATPEYTTLPKGPLEECVRTRLLTWMFPKPRGGVHVTVSYPFNFKILERE